MQENDGRGWKELPFEYLRSIAIYMDGYHFHASGKHNVFAKDFMKRQSIERSKQYMSVTLTWADMNKFEDADHPEDSVIDRHNGALLNKLGKNEWRDRRNSMERLLYVLGHLWEAKKLKDTLLMYTVGLQPSMSASIKLFPKQPWAALDVNVDLANHPIAPVFEVPMDIHPDEGLPEEQWQGFWRVYNLVSLYQGIETDAQHPKESAESKWEEIADEFDDELHEIVINLLKEGIEFEHHAGVAIKNRKGKKVCEVELVSEKHRFVFFPDDEEAVIAEGYKIFEPDTFDINDIK